MKNFGFKVNVIDSTLTMTKEFAKNAGIVGTDEYSIFQQLRNDFPTFKVQLKTIKKNPTKKSYKNLTVKAMGAYIKGFYPERGSEFVRICEAAAIQPSKYAYIKAWFLKTFPDYREAELPAIVTEEKPAVLAAVKTA